MTDQYSATAREYLAIPAPAVPDAARAEFDAMRHAYAAYMTAAGRNASAAELARLNEERDAAYSAYVSALARAKTAPAYIDPARPMYRAPLTVRALAAQALAAIVPARPYALWNSIDALDAYPHEAKNATAADRADARARLLIEAENMRGRKWTAYELNYIDAAETLK